jgi:xylulokinase
MYLLGLDIGSSSVKASLLDPQTGRVAGSDYFPKDEMPITAIRPGWAEQHPSQWWDASKLAAAGAMKGAGASASDVRAIGIAYQMHGLVCLDKRGQPIRPSIIWCDSRAVKIGDAALEALGRDTCLAHLLNGPGNFTASKLKWVRDHEPDLFAQVDKVCLPGDTLAARMTGKVATTVSGLSEGMLWDFKASGPAHFLLDHYGIGHEVLADIVPTFGVQGELTRSAADELGLAVGTPVTYRAGDQPNNALSLNVLNPGEIAATAGTSGVVYGVSGSLRYDPRSRINTFAHVNHSADHTRLGLLLCINGTGSANAWLRRTLGSTLSYGQMNAAAEQAPIGCDGLSFFPFGNGAERMLGNADPGANFAGLRFNSHGTGHLCRAVQEGIVFSFCYGIEIMQSIGMDPKVIRAGKTNMFQSDLFRQTLATVTGARIELYDTDGSVGAARGAGIGAGVFASPKDAFANLKHVGGTEPKHDHLERTRAAYADWRGKLEDSLGNPHTKDL